MSIVDGTGAVVVNYKYDPYGNILSTTGTLADTLGVINPPRYRGYVYDQECGLYYLQSRYYDAKVGRFLNADSYPSTGQGILGNNMFSYCGNNPVIRGDSTGQFWNEIVTLIERIASVCETIASVCFGQTNASPLPYESADEAARAFSEEIYSSSLYIRHEYSTKIYSITIDGKTTYGYTPPLAGNPHSASIGYSVPQGTTAVAYAHTHPNSNVFSSADKRAANSLSLNAYVVGPNLNLQRYDYDTAMITNLGLITPVMLTNKQKEVLVSQFQISWDNHVAEGCDFNCGKIAWPTS